MTSEWVIGRGIGSGAEIEGKAGKSLENEDQAGPVQLLTAQFSDRNGIEAVEFDTVVRLG